MKNGSGWLFLTVFLWAEYRICTFRQLNDLIIYVDVVEPTGIHIFGRFAEWEYYIWMQLWELVFSYLRKYQLLIKADCFEKNDSHL